MAKRSPVFDENYDFYLGEIGRLDLEKLAGPVGARYSDGAIDIGCLGREYRVSHDGVFDSQGARPPYAICIVLFKTLLADPPKSYVDSLWTAYREFKDAGPLVVFFANDVEKPVVRHFAGRTDSLRRACEKLGGRTPDVDVSRDVALQFRVLPRAPVLLLFDDADEEFSATCSVLFKRSLENYLDMESAAILGQLFTSELIRIDKGE